MDNAEALALLGTPNGTGVAWLLSQYQKELGHKVVKNVTLFWERSAIKDEGFKTLPSLVFRLMDFNRETEGW